MHKIGIISDTHGLLRPEVLEYLRGCELILHGGDINRQSILDQLGEIAPIKVVRGNNDKEWVEYIPETLLEDIYGLRVFMVHNKKFIPKDLTGIDLVVYGHSHKYEEKTMDGVQFLNPGSCGPRRFHQDITMAVLYINESASDKSTLEEEVLKENAPGGDAKNFRIEKILIPHPEEKGKENKSDKSDKNGIPSDIGVKLPAIMKDAGAGKTVKQIAKKYKISEALSEQILRMYLTHPGVDAEGILRRIGL